MGFCIVYTREKNVAEFRFGKKKDVYKRPRLSPGNPIKRQQHPRYTDFFVVAPHRLYDDVGYFFWCLHVQQERETITRFFHQTRIDHYRVNRSEFDFRFLVLRVPDS